MVNTVQEVAPTRLPQDPVGDPVLNLFGRSAARPTEVAPPAIRPGSLFGTAPTRPPEVAATTMQPIISPGDPGYVRPPREAVPTRPNVAPARSQAQGDGDDPTVGLDLRLGNWGVRIDTGIERRELPSITIPRIPGTSIGGWRIHTSPFDRQQAYIAEHGQSNERILPMVDDGVVTSNYGYRRHPITGQRHFHNGMDMDVPYGGDARLVAPVGGFIVVDRNASGAEGVMISIYGDDGNKYKLLHLERGSIPRDLSSGDRVEMGDLVGVIGNTGRSRGAHLHLIVEVPAHNPPRHAEDFDKVNPAQFFRPRGGLLRADIDRPGQTPSVSYAAVDPVARPSSARRGVEPVYNGPQNYEDILRSEGILSPQQSPAAGFTAVQYTPDASTHDPASPNVPRGTAVPSQGRQ